MRKILSIFLVTSLMLTSFPVSALATFDDSQEMLLAEEAEAYSTDNGTTTSRVEDAETEMIQENAVVADADAEENLEILATSGASTVTTLDVAGSTANVAIQLNAEATTFNVSVPASLPISVDGYGEVITADSVIITNESFGPVKITDINIEAVEGWTTADYDSFDVSSEKVNSRNMAFEIGGEKTTGENAITFTFSNWPSMDGENNTDSDELQITYSAKMPAQSQEISNAKLADVIFTIDWDTADCADYSAVNAALEKVPTDFSAYTEDSAQAVIDAVDAVEWNLPSTQQEVVNAYAAAIENAVLNLRYESSSSESVLILEAGGIVPEGGTYYVGVEPSSAYKNYATATAVYNAGDALPSISEYDRFVIGDYEYIYVPTDIYYGDECEVYDPSATPDEESTEIEDNLRYASGWNVYSLENKSEYGQIYATINGANVTTMNATFNLQTSMTASPIIPETVKVMTRTYVGCVSLTTLSNLPSSLSEVTGAFRQCTSLTTIPAIPASVTSLDFAFARSGIQTAPMFYCQPQSINYAFLGCTSLTTVSDMPDNVESMNSAFSGCTSLTTIPAIPASATDVSNAFSGCGNLTGSIEVNCNPEAYSGFITNTSITEITGSTTMKEELLATNGIFIVPDGYTLYADVPTDNAVGDYTGYSASVGPGEAMPLASGSRIVNEDYEYHVSVSGNKHVLTLKVRDATKTTYSEIPEKIMGATVTSMSYSFQNCTALLTAPEIPSTVTNVTGTFYGCTAMTTGPSTLPEGITSLNRTFMNCKKMATGPSNIPETVTDMQYAFYNCQQLTAIPAIPANVTNVSNALLSCKAMTTIEVNANPTTYTNFLKNSTITSITGSTTMADTLLATISG